MSTNDPWVHNPRQYRPSCSIPVSASMSNISSSPYRLPTPPPRLKGIKPYPRDLYNRRRTTSTLPRPDPLHSHPTVASSCLTASASIADISHPFPQTPQFAQLRMRTPTRIPTPVLDNKPQALRHGLSGVPPHSSTPVLPNQKRENIKPYAPKTLHVLGSISPTHNRPAPLLPKSKTMGMFSSLTSSISRSSLNITNLNKEKDNACRLCSRTAEPTTLLYRSSSPPLPTFTTNNCQIHTAQSEAYWCGRYQAVHDRFHAEILEASLNEPTRFRQYITVTNRQGKNSSDSNERTSTTFKILVEDEDRRIKRVFVHLDALCVTAAARKSLWDFQLAFARAKQNKEFLPLGGRMEDKSPGWVRRVGRAISDNISSGSSRVGRRSGLLPRRKGSVGVSM